ncbi:MAG: hypothetical protein JW384_01657 [Nitrosomonadaceae bacterium]|nr:hypothetical protein [Nitrosomonadaceae bacterium]
MLNALIFTGLPSPLTSTKAQYGAKKPFTTRSSISLLGSKGFAPIVMRGSEPGRILRYLDYLIITAQNGRDFPDCASQLIEGDLGHVWDQTWATFGPEFGPASMGLHTSASRSSTT